MMDLPLLDHWPSCWRVEICQRSLLLMMDLPLLDHWPSCWRAEICQRSLLLMMDIPLLDHSVNMRMLTTVDQPTYGHTHSLSGLVVKVSPSRAKDTKIVLRFPHTGALNTGTLLATLLAVWHCRVCTRTGCLTVSILWLGTITNLIRNLYLSVAAHTNVCADPPLRYTNVSHCDVRQPNTKQMIQTSKHTHTCKQTHTCLQRVSRKLTWWV